MSARPFAEVITIFSSNVDVDLRRFFEQATLSVMLRNGGAHLKNFGMLYSDADDVRLSPVFDVVTTAVYQFERPGGVLSEDRTMALKWLKGKTFAAKPYPTYGQLEKFAAHVCRGAGNARITVDTIAQAMSVTLARAASDPRIPGEFLESMRQQWAFGLAYADEAGAAGTRRKAGRNGKKRDSSGLRP